MYHVSYTRGRLRCFARFHATLLLSNLPLLNLTLHYTRTVSHVLLHLLRDGAGPHAEAEHGLVDEIRQVVADVDGTLLVVGGGGAEEGQVVSQRIDGPAVDNDLDHVVVSLLDGLGRAGAGGFLALTVGDLSDHEGPEDDGNDETGEDGAASSLTSVTETEHTNGLDHQTGEDGCTKVGHGGLEDEVELEHQERDGDQPIGVTVDGGGVLSQHPSFTHVAVVPEGDQGHETGDGQGSLPLQGDSVSLGEEESGGRQHRRAGYPEHGTDDIVGTEGDVGAHSLDDRDAFLREGEGVAVLSTSHTDELVLVMLGDVPAAISGFSERLVLKSASSLGVELSGGVPGTTMLQGGVQGVMKVLDDRELSGVLNSTSQLGVGRETVDTLAVQHDLVDK